MQKTKTDKKETNRKHLFFAAKTAAVVTALWGVAFLSGYPPPQRLIVPSQRAEFARFKAECEGFNHVEMGGMGNNLGDNILPISVTERRSKLLCTEALYRIEHWGTKNQ
ncbi:hypothetical protein KKE92_04880 [Candidatus Micrarchaeota archaeon]|nr:hypothetical protein [Candidatus Micrarchaeota archaeon]